MGVNKIQIKNKKAFHDFEIIEKYVAGLILTGTEIKSLRLGKAALVDSYCYFRDMELYVKNMNIAEYSYGGHYNHKPDSERKLLLTKRELRKLNRGVREKGFTIITLKLFITEKGYAKLEIALARGKKEYDKREEIKKKDIQRQLDRISKR